MNTALVAFSIDAMLPALPVIAAEISPDFPNRAQLVLTSFVLGMGFGTFVTGPLSDIFGRKPVILVGTALFILGAVLAGQATTLEGMVFARVLQGLGVAGPRIVALAIVRDLYAGRQMAQIISYAMMIFTLVPAIAPAFGAVIMEATGWRSIFLAFVLFAIFAVGWLTLRQPETLPRAARQPFNRSALVDALRACLSERIFVLSALAQSVTYAMLFAALSSIQPIFGEVYDRADSFPAWFAVIALIGGLAAVLNARLVIRLGMRRMILLGFFGQATISGLVVAAWLGTGVPFALFMVWTTSVFFMTGLVIGNLNALALEPLGHVAGMAASLMGSIATILGAALAIPVGLAFNGTVLPLSLSICLLALSGALILKQERPAA
ncbi:MAG: multidrug effflux MFS transporter [Litoreibacter sp.]|nr:multidrug effflux MFS transporter [Litoreibacter sp.]